MRPGELLYVTRAASPQFVKPIFFRVIKVFSDRYTYPGWMWLEGYQLNERGEAIARREIFVRSDGLQAGRPRKR